MNRVVIKYCIITFVWLAVLYPLLLRMRNVQLSFDATLPLTLFPFFGLTAFALLWLHSISGVFEPWLKQYINFERFVYITSTIILICIVAHPILLLVGLEFNIGNVFLYYGAPYIWLAIIAWILLITYDIGKALKKYDFFVKHWNKILLISNIGFLLTFLHSLKLGSDLQSGSLRFVWIFYGITATLSIIYTYGRVIIKPHSIRRKK